MLRKFFYFITYIFWGQEVHGLLTHKCQRYNFFLFINAFANYVLCNVLYWQVSV